MNVVVLCGGVGAARFLLGFHELPHINSDLNVSAIVNTGDDETIYNHFVSPDIDSILYHLSGLHDKDRGWGQKNETFHFVDSLRRLGEDAWFNLGDRDLALNNLRTRLLNEGKTLTEVTQILSEKLGVTKIRVLPMCDEKISTVITTSFGEHLSMQEYFVKEKCQPKIESVNYVGSSKSGHKLSQRHIKNADLIIFAPSNPILSILPIFSIPDLERTLCESSSKKIAISPMVGNESFKGPLSKNLKDLGYESNSLGIASIYSSFIDEIFIHPSDKELKDEIEKLNIQCTLHNIFLDSAAKRSELVSSVLERYKKDD